MHLALDDLFIVIDKADEVAKPADTGISRVG